MRRTLHKVVSLLGLVAVACIQVSLSAKIPDRPKIRILTTVFPLQEFARAIAGDRGDVSLLLPPGAEVHTWQPRTSDIKKLSSLDVFLYIGQNLEPWVEDILKSAAGPNVRILEVGPVVLGMPADDKESLGPEPSDPHVWLDFGYDQVILDRILDVLIRIEPDSKAYFEQSAASYKEKLRLLDDRYREAFAACLHKAFIFGGHSAFANLARRYNLEQIPVYGRSPDAAPTPKELARIIADAKKRNIKTIFIEPNVSDKIARQIASELEADIRVLNPGHNLTKEQRQAGITFLDLMEQNLESFKHGLVCR
jgi:zinc transport system substrate-binding protein